MIISGCMDQGNCIKSTEKLWIKGIVLSQQKSYSISTNNINSAQNFRHIIVPGEQAPTVQFTMINPFAMLTLTAKIIRLTVVPKVQAPDIGLSTVHQNSQLSQS
jgi:hypothetical protein